MSEEIAWKQNILVTDFHLLKSLLVVLGFGSQPFVCGFSRQNINSVLNKWMCNQCHVRIFCIISFRIFEGTKAVNKWGSNIQ